MRRTDTMRYSLRLIYICFLIVYMAIREVTPLQFLINSVYVSGGVFVLGFVLILWELVTDQTCLRGRGVDLLVLFTLLCCISAAINYRYGLGGNIKAVGALLLEYFLLYTAGLNRTEQQVKRELRTIAATLSVIWCVLVVLSINMYVFDVEYVVSGSSQGFNSTHLRLWGIFQDPNYAGFISLIAVYAAMYLMSQYRKVWVYVLCCLQIGIQFCYIVLGGSRAALLLLIASVALLGSYLFVLMAKKRLWDIFRGGLLTAGTVCVVLLLFVAMQYILPLYKSTVRYVIPDKAGVQAVYDRLYSVTDAQTVDKAPEQVADEEIDFIHRTDTEKADVSNGRFARWKDTVSVFLKSPLFGTSPRNVSTFAKEHAPKTLMALYGIAPHNGYLDVLVGSGVLGFAALFVFLCMAATVLLRRLLQETFTPEKAFAAICVFLLAGSAVFVSDIFFFFTAGAVFFWMMLGYALHAGTAPSRESLLFRMYQKLFKKR